MNEYDRKPSRLAALPLAIVFLFETWVWRKLVALAQFVASLLPWERFRDAARRFVNRAPALSRSCCSAFRWRCRRSARSSAW